MLYNGKLERDKNHLYSVKGTQQKQIDAGVGKKLNRDKGML